MKHGGLLIVGSSPTKGRKMAAIENMSQSTEIVALSQPAFGEKCFLDGYRPDGSRPEGAETYQPKGSALGIGVAFWAKRQAGCLARRST
jgi:hypothetical protein